jgi:hypothetical protein
MTTSEKQKSERQVSGIFTRAVRTTLKGTALTFGGGGTKGVTHPLREGRQNDLEK